jgi:hypothetical protein
MINLKSRRNQILGVILSLLVLVALTGCVPGDGKATPTHLAGFFWGIWHGWLAPVSLIIGLFDHSIRVYEVQNTGWWYDFGYYMALLGGFGGLSLFRSRRASSKRTSNRED